MPRLIPEKRFDRNGRLVTKHVLSAPVSSSQAGSLPAPAVTSVSDEAGPEQRFRWFIEESQRRGIPPRVFTVHYAAIDDRYRDSPYLYDAVEFKSAGFNEGSGNEVVTREILKGEISLSDLKAIGLTKLRDDSRAYSLLVALEAIQKKEADYTVEDLGGLVDQAIAERASEMEFSTAVDTVFNCGMESIKGVSMEQLDAKHYDYFRSGFRPEKETEEPRKHVFKLMAYAAQVRTKVGKKLDGAFVTDEFCEAGIPAELAADVLRIGGSLTQAKAIHEEGIENSLSGGWL